MDGGYIKSVYFYSVISFVLFLIFVFMMYGDGFDFITFLLCFLMLSCSIGLFTAVYGFHHRDEIDLADDVARFDPEVAFSGGAWAGVGIGIYAIVNEWEFVKEMFWAIF